MVPLPGVAQGRYQLQDLRTLPGYRDVQAAAASPLGGEVVGFASDYEKPDTRSVLFRQGSWTDLGPQFVAAGGIGGGQATAINAFGDVAGWFSANDGSRSGFIFLRSGVFQTVRAFGRPTQVTALNAWRQAAGSYYSDAGQNRAFVCQPDGSVLDLGTFGASWAVARALNDAGQVLVVYGDAYDTSTRSAVAFPMTGAVRSLGTLGGSSTVAFALNRLGQSVGYSTTAKGDLHAFFDDGVSMRDLGTLPGGVFTEANGLSDDGVIVGHGDAPQDPKGLSHAWVYRAGTMQDLNDLTLPTPDRWTVVEATGVTLDGQIVALATNPSLTTRVVYHFHGNPPDTRTVTYPDYHVVRLTPVNPRGQPLN